MLDQAPEKLSQQVIWTYSIPRIGFGIMGFLFSTYLMKFSTDVLLIAPAVMGGIIAASRFWDAISDPMVGYLSDRTRSPLGRRRVWMFASAIPVGIGIVMMWSPPTVIEGIWIVVWMATALLVYETASTAFYVPYGALGVELTPNYHERTRLFGYSHMITAIGSLLGLYALYLMDSAEDKREAAFMISLFAGIVVTCLILGATSRLRERKEYQGRGGSSAYKSIADVFRNPHSFLLITVYGIETFGAASVGMLVPYLVTYVVPDALMPVEKSMFLIVTLAFYTVPQFLFTPLWMKLSTVFGKNKLWTFSMWLSAFTFAGFFFALEFPALIWIFAFTLGFSGGCGAVVAPSIKADIIDYDEYLTGERKEGAYLAVWNLIRKGAASLAALLTGIVLQAVGFEPNADQSEDVKFALRALFSLFPAVCYVIGATIFLRFSFNEKEHSEVRRVLDERARSEAPSQVGH